MKKMVRHMILWQLRDDLTEKEKKKIKAEIKKGLEGLRGKVPGLLSVRVITESLQSSTADIMLDSLFTNEQALKDYAVHPAHVEVADTKVRPFIKLRLCIDLPIG